MFRFETLALTALLAIPVLGLWLRGDFTDEDAGIRLFWCLLAAWLAVSLLRYAATPRSPVAADEPADDPDEHDADHSTIS